MFHFIAQRYCAVRLRGYFLLKRPYRGYTVILNSSYATCTRRPLSEADVLMYSAPCGIDIRVADIMPVAHRAVPSLRLQVTPALNISLALRPVSNKGISI